MSLTRRRSIAAAGGVAPDPPAPALFQSFDVADPDLVRFAYGGQGLFQRIIASSRRRVRVWDTPGDVADVEILAKLGVTQSDVQWCLAARVSGSGGSEEGFLLKLLGGTGGVQIQKGVAGTFTTLGTDLTDVEYQMRSARWWWFRFRVNGTTVKAKFWLDGDAEPTTGGPDDDGYQRKETESDVAGAGKVGLYTQDSGVNNSDYEFADANYCDYFGVGINGAVAPGPDDTPGTDQFADDFSGYTASLADDNLTGWSKPWGDSAFINRVVDDGRARRLLWDGWRPFWASPTPRNDDAWQAWRQDNDRVFIGWVDAGIFADVEVAARMRSTSTNDQQMRLHARSGGEDGTETGYHLELEGANTILLAKYVSGALTSLASASFTWDANVWYQMKLRVEGTTIKGKVWADGDPEPTTGGPDGDGFQLKVTDADLADGYVGYGSLRSFGTKDVADFAVTDLT